MVERAATPGESIHINAAAVPEIYGPRTAALAQQRRSVVKSGRGRGQSSQAIKLFQATQKIGFAFHF